MLETKGADLKNYFNVSGIIIYDPTVTDIFTSDEAPTAQFVKANQNR